MHSIRKADLVNHKNPWVPHLGQYLQRTTRQPIAYDRVSPRQSGSGSYDTLWRQAHIEEQLQAVKGLPLAAFYCEVASGYILNRPKLQMAVEHAKRIDGYILVWSIHRLIADPIPWMMERIVGLGVQFVSVMPSSMSEADSNKDGQRLGIAQNPKDDPFHPRGREFKINKVIRKGFTYTDTTEPPET